MKGYSIDCDYIVNVKELMSNLELPHPARRLRDIDGSRLPLILVECEV